MPLAPLYGHEDARALLARAARGGTLPHSLLLHGPPGIGKERLGLWTAQLLLCDADPSDEPCGTCAACRAVLRLEHPDVHWFFPLPRPEATAADKLRERLEEARAAELEAFRRDALHQPRFDRAPAYFLASIQALQQLATVRPALGRRKVFVVGDAERMVPQESSPEAANAFLKLLEEPPPATTLIVTSSQPGALLPTVRSRVLPLRVLPLATDEVARFLHEIAGLPHEAAERTAAAAHGAIGRALQLLPAGDAASPLEAQRLAARAMLEAALVDSAVPRLALAHQQGGGGARHELSATLESLAEALRDLLAVAAGADDEVADRELVELLRRAVATRGIQPRGVAAALGHLAQAQGLAQGNVNPQLIVATLLHSLQTSLRGAES